MSLFTHPEFAGHERIIFCSDAPSGLQAIIAVHSTALGPAAGGCRMYPYGSVEDALRDVLRLSRGMTLKNALAGLPLGGGKSVIIGDPGGPKKQEQLQAFGRHVEAQGGTYWTAEDVGVGVEDLTALGSETRYVFGTGAGAGDPSPFTAKGVFLGLKAAVEFKFGLTKLQGVRVAVQGLGAVGFKLARMLKAEGACLVVADPDETRVRQAAEELGALVVSSEDIHQAATDVFAPCAMGGVLNSKSISELRCRIVAGAANNQLATPADGLDLAQRGILYAPDFLVNAGGMLAVSREIFGTGEVTAEAVDPIYRTAMKVFECAQREGITPEVMAERIAEHRIRDGRHSASP